MRVIYFDTETTGVNPSMDDVIELAFRVYEDGECFVDYDTLIDIGRSIPKKITDITGITTKMIKDGGASTSKVCEDLTYQLNFKPLMVAHNCQFDLNFIYKLLCKYEHKKDVMKLLAGCDWLDTLTVLKDRKKYPHKLEDMVDYYNVTGEGFHRAGEDASVLHNCILAMREERNDLKEYVNVFGYHPKHGVMGKRFDFITYKAQAYHNSICDADDILPYCEPLVRH